MSEKTRTSSEIASITKTLGSLELGSAPGAPKAHFGSGKVSGIYVKLAVLIVMKTEWDLTKLF